MNFALIENSNSDCDHRGIVQYLSGENVRSGTAVDGVGVGLFEILVDKSDSTYVIVDKIVNRL